MKDDMTGGPAFPVSVNIPPGHFHKGPAADSGMTLHAFYAGLAMMAHRRSKMNKELDSEYIARWAHEDADAMIIEMRRRENQK